MKTSKNGDGLAIYALAILTIASGLVAVLYTLGGMVIAVGSVTGSMSMPSSSAADWHWFWAKSSYAIAFISFILFWIFNARKRNPDHFENEEYQ